MATPPSSFEVVAQATTTHARRGRLRLRHGTVQTPAFMPVGTYGAVKGLVEGELRDLGADIILSNTFHLVCRPGAEAIGKLGGLHRFMGWDGPILTDSGGFQVFSLSDRRRIDEDGVTFSNPLNGTPVRMTPESTIQAQIDLGVDVAMVLDEVLAMPAADRDVRKALDRTHRWAARARAVPLDPETGPAVFGIVQGGLSEELRAASIDSLEPLDFDGYAIGGLSVGESSEDMNRVVRFAAPRLPARKTRYLMGVGYPEDIIEAVAAGVDLFDCVLPTRNARTGNLFTSRGRLIIKHSAWRDDPRPVDEECECSACARYSRAYMRHLFLTGEMLGRRLYTIHNLYQYQRLMRRIRASIEVGTFPELLAWARTRDAQGRTPSAQRWPDAPPMPAPAGT